MKIQMNLNKIIVCGILMLLTACGGNSEDTKDAASTQALPRSCNLKDKIDGTRPMGICLDYQFAAGTNVDVAEVNKSCSDEGGVPSNSTCSLAGVVGNCKLNWLSSMSVIYRIYNNVYTTDMARVECQAIGGEFSSSP